ncbi:hypothetical protein SBRCBS47491_000956 [Sporothrix bragantina]|uniref:Altered inheritance of mitochondria protein 6 n=1 Tax=Sporothrix bragantina TaxID=671064 RepID=A0ABP0AUM1_9PEZI
MACLTVLLVLVVLVLTVHAVYDHGDYHDGSSDTILANLGLSGSDSQPPSQYAADFLRDVVPIACHSHNDYWRKVPLFTALHAGCIGTEADVWLVDDDLYVGHDQSALTPNRTLQSLYLDPLMDILERANPSTNASSGISTTPRGVFDMSPNQTLSLLIDVKTDGAATFRKVLEQVEPLRQRGWLSTFDNGKVQLGPITLVGSGNTPFHVVIENSTYRYAFFDAPLDQLEDSMYNSTNSYYSSVGLRQALGIVWFGWFRNSQIERMSEQLQQAHERGLKARYWSLPSWPVQVRDAVWGTLIYEGVDLLNVDDVEAAAHADWTKKKSN